MSDLVAITGNTYPVRDKIRALGGKWDKEAKAWMVPAELAAEVKALVPADKPKSTPAPNAQSNPRQSGNKFEGMVPFENQFSFEIKDQLKEIGGRWNPDQKVWMVPQARLFEARVIGYTVEYHHFSHREEIGQDYLLMPDEWRAEQFALWEHPVPDDIEESAAASDLEDEYVDVF